MSACQMRPLYSLFTAASASHAQGQTPITTAILLHVPCQAGQVMPHIQLQAGRCVRLCISPHSCSLAHLCKVDMTSRALLRWAKVAVLCCAALCCAMLRCAVLRRAALRCAVLCCAGLSCAVQCSAVLCRAVLRHSMPL